MNEFDISELSVFFNSQYSLKFTIQVKMYEISEGYQEMYLANSNNTKLGGRGYKEYCYGGGGLDDDEDWTPEFSLLVPGTNCTNIMHMIYGAAGEGSDDWKLCGFKVKVTVVKGSVL